MLNLVVRMIFAPGTPAVTSLGAYSNFDYHVAGYDGKLETFPHSSNHEDTDANLAAAVAHDSPLMYFSVPDNPIGTWYSASDVQSLIGPVVAGKLMVLHARAVERAYAPGGRGFEEAKDDFEERASKVRRIE